MRCDAIRCDVLDLMDAVFSVAKLHVDPYTGRLCLSGREGGREGGGIALSYCFHPFLKQPAIDHRTHTRLYIHPASNGRQGATTLCSVCVCVRVVNGAVIDT